MGRRRLHLGGAVAGVALMLLGAGTPAVAATAPTPGELLLYAVTATKAEKSVHFAATSVDKNESTTLAADVSQLGYGQFSVVIHIGADTGHVTGRYAGGVIYFKGDNIGLADYLGFSPSQVRAYTGKWVRFTSSTPGFTSLVSGFTLQAAVAEVSISAPWTTGPKTTIGGVKVQGVRGTWQSLTVAGKSGPAILYIAANGTHLPIRLNVQSGGAHPASHGEVTFTHWNEKFTVRVPSGAVAFV